MVTEKSPRSLKLKIKLDQPIPTVSTMTSSKKKSVVGKDDTFKTKKAGDETSDEEKEWLMALEKGELDDTGRVKKNIDTSLMTARQRARYERGDDDEEIVVDSDSIPGTLSLPHQNIALFEGSNKQKILTAEQRQRRAQKRREQALKKREKEKKATIERLLKKQDNKRSSKQIKRKINVMNCVRLCYNKTGITINIPKAVENMHCEYVHQNKKEIPNILLCGVEGCKNKRKYECRKTGVSLCSLKCYKQNLLNKSL